MTSQDVIFVAGGLAAQTFPSTTITLPCKVLFGIPFFFSFCFHFLWPLISVYRLFLVVCSVCRILPTQVCSSGPKMTVIIPSTSFLLSLVSACLASYFSDSFLLYRVCLGTCDTLSSKDEWIATFFNLVPAIMLYLPAGASYAAIFFLVRHARRKRMKDQGEAKSVFSVATADPASDTVFLKIPLHGRGHQRNSAFEISTSFASPGDTSCQSELQDRARKRMSLPAKLNTSTLISKAVKTKLSRRNIISAKVSCCVMFVLCLGGGVVSVTYNNIQIVQVLLHVSLLFYQQTCNSFVFQNLDLQTRAFINALFIDLMLVVFSPLLLLYSSTELRYTASKILRTKCKI